MRIASFNVENLFARARALNMATWAEGRPALAAYERFNRLANKLVYTQTDKDAMLAALLTLRILVQTPAGSLRLNKNPYGKNVWALLRENRGDFLKQPKTGDVEIVAVGRAAWIGWVELIKDAIGDRAVYMTGRVILDVDADALCVIEAEDRPGLVRFNEDVLNDHYAHIMLVDGNDPRGIDIGLLAKDNFDIESVQSHVDAADPAKPDHKLFSRDCPVYKLQTASGNTLWLLLNHLKSQSFTSGDPDPLRTRQSDEVRVIYDKLRGGGAQYVAIMGDFNKGPDKGPPVTHPTLQELFGHSSDLVDASSLTPEFDFGPREGTFQRCSLREKLDYILLSPELAAKVTEGGVMRSGLWGGPTNKKPPADWFIYPEITKAAEAASDHAAVYVDVTI